MKTYLGMHGSIILCRGEENAEFSRSIHYKNSIRMFKNQPFPDNPRQSRYVIP